MTRKPNRFHDSDLKKAVRKAYSGETAPVELRRRIEGILENEHHDQIGGATPDSIRVAPTFWRRTSGLVAASAAAVVLMLGVGIIAVNVASPRRDTLSQTTDPISTATAGLVATVPAGVLPVELGKQIVRGHDICVRYHPDEHHAVEEAAKTDYAAIERTLELKVDHEVIATSIEGGWTFHGASMCPFGAQRVPHLMYKQGKTYLSVYSLPASLAPTLTNRQNSEVEIDGRTVAGFVEGNGFYCVVGSTPVNATEIHAIRDQLRANVIAKSMTAREVLASAWR